MTNTLTSPKVAAVLARLYADAEENDPKIMAAIQAEANAKLGGVRDHNQLEHWFEKAYISVAPEVGRLFYILTRNRRPKLAVEFGTSMGISAIHYAAALRDNGAGRLITSEKSDVKVARARENVAAAGLADLVEFRAGDALQSLKTMPGPVDLLFLDGWKDLYMPVLKLLEPSLSPGALIVADDVVRFPERMGDYLTYVRAPANGYTSLTVPIDDGVELSIRN